MAPPTNMHSLIKTIAFVAALLTVAGCGAPADETAGNKQTATPSESAPESAADQAVKAPAEQEEAPTAAPPSTSRQTAPPPNPQKKTPKVPVKPDQAVEDDDTQKIEFSNVVRLDNTIRLDIRYATSNNFTKAKIYDCPMCLLRPEAANAVVKAHKMLREQGYGGLKMFDCYRPRPYQQRLWDKVPNPDYVTPPAKGSMHSRGAAVDLTIVDKQGRELDMGTEYDYFGEKGHYDYTNLPKNVLDNRRLLRKTMEAVGFQGIRTEWWHFSFRGADYPFSDYLWDCE
jgi:zinc D-Ala-D-Ala dipeptidase